MSDDAIDTVYGCAIDNKNTRKSHQIISSTYDYNGRYNTLHYTVFSPKPSHENYDLFSSNVKDILYNEQALKDKAQIGKMHSNFSEMMSIIVDRKHRDRACFVLNVPANTYM